jgi:AraC-like DNA-binding protein
MLQEKIIYEGGYLFGSRKFQSDTYYKPWHFHPEYELMLIHKGNGKFFVDNAVHNFKDNDLIFLGPNIPHFYLCDTDYIKVHGNNYIRQVLQFTEAVFPAQVHQAREFQNIDKLLEKSKFGIQFKRTSSVEKAIEALKNINLKENLLRLESLYSILDLLGQEKRITQLLTYDYDETKLNKYNDVVNRVIEYLTNNIREDVALKNIAAYVNYTPNTLCNQFKKSTGKTIFDYLNEIRIQYSWKLLVHTEKTITEIAYDSGYNSISHFNEQFVKYSSMIPSAYRNIHRKMQDIPEHK